VAVSGSEPDIEASLVAIDGMPLTQVMLLDEDDTVLANSIRRIRDAAGRLPQETVAAFQTHV
jgi:FXSXX-COOH protein